MFHEVGRISASTQGYQNTFCMSQNTYRLTLCVCKRALMGTEPLVRVIQCSCIHRVVQRSCYFVPSIICGCVFVHTQVCVQLLIRVIQYLCIQKVIQYCCLHTGAQPLRQGDTVLMYAQRHIQKDTYSGIQTGVQPVTKGDAVFLYPHIHYFCIHIFIICVYTE